MAVVEVVGESRIETQPVEPRPEPPEPPEAEADPGALGVKPDVHEAKPQEGNIPIVTDL